MHTGCITQASSLLEFYGSMAGTHGCTQNADITAVPPWSARVQPYCVLVEVKATYLRSARSRAPARVQSESNNFGFLSSLMAP
jgi:hypothetical protein